MKRVVIVLGILMLWTMGVHAQDNLLTNPGFEPPFTEFEGNPVREVAEGWQPWHIAAAPGAPSFQNRQPEYASTAPDETRIRNGSDAQQIFSFFATHDGGVFQTVSGITPGTDLRFSVYAYVWSTTFEEPDISEEDGDVSVEVGIDPSGGVDPTSANVVWSEPTEQYDAYNEYMVEAQASSSSVTVFVRTSAGVPVKHNNIYLDDASLVAAGEATEEATQDATAPAELTEETTPANDGTPTATPEGEQPTSTPTIPSPTPVTPTETPITPSATVIAPSVTPVTPSATPVTPTETPITPTGAASPIPASTTPSTPEVTVSPAPASATPVTPSATPSLAPASPTPFPQEVTPTSNVPTATPTLPGTITNQFPFTVMHTVARNETVAILAERYGSSVEAIALANNLDTEYLIFVGQQLIIPVAAMPTTPSATSVPTQIFVTATPGQPVPPLGSNNIYVVMPGDSLTRIARLFNTSVGALAQLNGIVNPNVIQVGQQLMIPGMAPVPTPTSAGGTIPTATLTPIPNVNTGTEYIVRPGDSLYVISLRFGVPIYAIAQANNIRNTWLIYAGQRLIIP